MQAFWRALLSCPSPSRVVLHRTLLWAHEKLPLSLLINSGADDSFIDGNLARQAGLPVVELTDPKTVLDLNGGTLARVTHRTETLTLLVSGNHCEHI